MAPTQITEGNYRRLIFQFTDQNNNPADPTTVNAYIQHEDNPPTPITPTRDSQGTYHYDQYLNKPGRWYYGGNGTGTITATCPDQHIDVQATKFPIPTI